MWNHGCFITLGSSVKDYHLYSHIFRTESVKYTYASYVEPIYAFQKKAIRIITFSPPCTSSKPLFSGNVFLSIHSINKFHVACFVFSPFNILLPTPVSSILHFNYEYHDHMTRSPVTSINLLLLSRLLVQCTTALH